jgi:hypothetical protein
MKGENKIDVKKGSIGAADPFLAAPPGISLTSDNTKWPWGQPPQDVDVNVILEKATDRLDNDPVFLDEMFKLLVAGISVEHIVETWLIDGFEGGKFSLDAGLLAKSPLAVYIAYLAEENGVPYKMFERQNPMADERMDDSEYFDLLKQNNPRLFSQLRENLNETVRMGISSANDAEREMMEQANLEAEQPEEGFMMQQQEEGVV